MSESQYLKNNRESASIFYSGNSINAAHVEASNMMAMNVIACEKLTSKILLIKKYKYQRGEEFQVNIFSLHLRLIGLQRS